MLLHGVHLPSLIVDFLAPTAIFAFVTFLYWKAGPQGQRRGLNSFFWHPLVFVGSGFVAVFLSFFTFTPEPVLDPKSVVLLLNTLFVLGALATALALAFFRGNRKVHFAQLLNIPAAVYLWYFCLFAILHDGP